MESLFSCCLKKKQQQPIPATKEEPWSKVIDFASRAVVMLRINQVRSFAGESAQSAIATGFVVDKKRGILLTNRHVVTTGPVGSCFICNHKYANHFY